MDSFSLNNAIMISHIHTLHVFSVFIVAIITYSSVFDCRCLSDKMPWFCGSSKKRHSRAKIGGISPPLNDTSIVANGRPSFTVMLQDFNGAVSDELSAHRGQVLEALFFDKEWVYVRNIDGKCGYVPQTFCYALDTVNDAAFQRNVANSSKHRTRPVSLHLNTTSSMDHGSQNSVGVNHTQEQVDGHSDTTQITRQASTATPDPAQPSSSSASSKPRHRRSLSNGSEQNTKTNSVTPDRTISTPLSQHIAVRRSFHRRSLSNGSQRTITNLPTVTPTNPATLSSTNPATLSSPTPEPSSNPNTQRPTHRRSLSSGSQQCVSRTIAGTSPTSAPTQGPSVERASSTSRLYIRRQSCPAVGSFKTDTFKYTPYSARPGAVKRSVSMNEGGARVHSRHPALHRSCSYKEAVCSNSEQLNTVGLSSDRLDIASSATATDRHSSSDSPVCTRKNCDCSRRSAGPNRRRSKLSRQLAIDYDDSSDDVFLSVSKEKKPYGIFRCLEDRRPSFKGEIALRKDELVIVLDHGKGQWAWAMTSQQVEGLVPKKLISRYEPDRSMGGVRHTDATTQTELAVNGDTRQMASSACANTTNTTRQQSTASNASTNAARQVSSASSASGGQSGSISPLNTLSTQTTTEISPTEEALDESWFSFEDSLERSLSKKSTPIVSRRLPKSAPVTPVTPDARRPRRLIDSTDKRKSLSFRPLSDLTQRSSPALLSAIKDYEPPENTGGCLTLKKGDVLTPQLHMHYPKGWMWVWHADQKRFGYVPNNSVMYTYPITRKARRTSTVEAEV